MVLASTNYESFADSIVWEYLIQIFTIKSTKTIA